MASQHAKKRRTKSKTPIKGMDQRTAALYVALATVFANLVFALTGVTQSVSCTVGQAAEHLQASALAAFDPYEIHEN